MIPRVKEGKGGDGRGKNPRSCVLPFRSENKGKTEENPQRRGRKVLAHAGTQEKDEKKEGSNVKKNRGGIKRGKKKKGG